MSKQYPKGQRERAVGTVLDHLNEYDTLWGACQAAGPKLGIGAGSVGLKSTPVPAPPMTSQEHGEIGRLKREVADLKRRVRFCGRRQLFSLENLTVHAEMVSHVQACWDRLGLESTYRVLGATAETPARPRN